MVNKGIAGICGWDGKVTAALCTKYMKSGAVVTHQAAWCAKPQKAAFVIHQRINTGDG